MVGVKENGQVSAHGVPQTGDFGHSAGGHIDADSTVPTHFAKEAEAKYGIQQ